jgi:ABC-type transporter Mla subunit MlaD
MRNGTVALLLLLLLSSCAAINKTTENLETTTKHLETTTEKFPEMIDQTQKTLTELETVGSTIREEIPKLGNNITILQEKLVESLDNVDTNIVEIVEHIDELKVALVGDDETGDKGLSDLQNRFASLGTVLIWVIVGLGVPMLALVVIVIHHKVTSKKRHTKFSLTNQ